MKKIIPKHDKILIKIIEEEEERHGNIVVPDMGKEKPEIGEVVAVGDGIYNYHTDNLIPFSIKVGDIVYFPKMGVQSISRDGEDYVICQENQILATLIEINE